MQDHMPPYRRNLFMYVYIHTHIHTYIHTCLLALPELAEQPLCARVDTRDRRGGLEHQDSEPERPEKPTEAERG